jgi:cytochrome c-type biogenesis protein CcsB
MDILEIESFFANSSFFLLFISMSSYWIQVIFSFQKLNFGRLFMICANFCLLALLILRWKESGHFPLSNLYESLMFLSWSLSSFHLILENIELGTSSIFAKINTKSNFSEKTLPSSFLGALTSPPALFTNAFATFSLPIEMQHSGALVPALQSNWLMMHVTVMIVSYSALICGSLLSIAFLIFTRNVDLNFSGEDKGQNQFETNDQKSFPNEIALTSATNSSTQLSLSLNSTSPEVGNRITNMSQNIGRNSESSLKKKFAEQLDNLSYRILGIGFPFLTIGILSGAVWANEAWGSYWSWDPKETWALATWLVFAIYLHTRLTKGWKGKKPALIASLGFVTVWICFLGVNLLGEGLHSYGFFKGSL